MSAFTIIVIALLSIAMLNVLTIAATLLTKAQRARRERHEKKVRDQIEPDLYEYLVLGEISQTLHRASKRESSILAAMIIELLNVLRGVEHEKITGLAAKLGLVQRDFDMLQSRNRWQKARAAENLGYYGGREATDPLDELLYDEDETVRAVAARALSRIGTQEAAVALAERLDSSSELTILRIAENLERIGPLAVEPLLELIESEDEEKRNGQVIAAQILGNLRVVEARATLRKAVTRYWNTDLRAQATLSLGKIGDPDDVTTILEAAKDDRWPVRAQAANALEIVGETSTITTLEKLTTDQEWWVRLNASRALVNMGDEGEKALARMLESSDRYARDRAAAAMENRGVTRRMVMEMSGSGERAQSSRRVIQTLIRNGTTRHLGYIARTLPKGEEHRELREMLAATEAESDGS